MATPQGGSASQRYAYDSSNHRIYAGTTSDNINYTNEQIYFYGADGKKLGVWSLTWLNSAPILTNTVINQWFGGRLLKPQDRLQSNGKYFPYGEDRYGPNPANPSNDQEKFATYTRDSATGLDYANQRYYAAGLGRFASPDPYGASASAQAPQTLNRFVYANNDPIRNFDPTGLICSADEDNCEGGGGDDGGGDGGGGAGNPARGGGHYPLDPPSDFPECNKSGSPHIDHLLQFLVDNYGAASKVAVEVNQDFKMTIDAGFILGWSQAESGNGYVVPASGHGDVLNPLATLNSNYFSLRGGVEAVPCAPGSVARWACFPTYQAAAESAFYSPLLIFGYGGTRGAQTLSAGYILADQFSRGATIAKALQATASGLNGRGGFDPGNSKYGQGAAQVIAGTEIRLNCLRSHGYI